MPDASTSPQPGASAPELLASVRAGGSPGELARAGARVPRLHVDLVRAGAPAREIGEAITAVADALTRRLMELAEAELGSPPVPYAWLACGSGARHEQAVSSDQDNALLLSSSFDPAAHGPWFEALARRVNDGLAECGFRHCPGGAMASNPDWRLTEAGWKERFTGWIGAPTRKALMHVGLFFDMRVVAGDASPLAGVQEHVRRSATASQVFLDLLAEIALHASPPLGLFRRFVVARRGAHAGTLDVKRGGVMPVVELARVHALKSGSAALHTADRLHDAGARGLVSRAGADELARALALCAGLRARHQAGQLERGVAPDNHLGLHELSPTERDELRAAFVTISRHQASLAQAHQVGHGWW